MAGRRVFYAHGTGDDNVHFQNTVMLVNELVALGNDDFELMFYPNRQHGIAANGAKAHSRSRLAGLGGIRACTWYGSR